MSAAFRSSGPSADERERRVGVGLSALLLRMNTGQRRDGWVHIRVERITLLDVATFRRELSVDFTYPTWLPAVEHMLELMETAPVPITLLSKGTRLAAFSVQAEDGRHLPVLTRSESMDRASGCLLAVARTVAKGRRVRLHPEIERMLSEVVRRPADAAITLLAQMREHAERAAGGAGAADKVFGPYWQAYWVPRNRTQQQWDDDRVLAPHGEELLALLSDPTLNTLARGLATQFLLITPLLPESIRQRRTIRMAYQDLYRPPAEGSLAGRAQALLLEALGWKPTVYEFEVPGISRAQRYQAEVDPPDSLQIIFGELRAGLAIPVDTPPPPSDAPIPRALRAAWTALRSPQPRWQQAPVARALTAAARALRHPRPSRPELLREPIRASDSLIAVQFESAVDVAPTSQGSLLIGFQPSRVGIVRAGPLLAAFVTAVLFLGKGRLSEIHADASSALLLAVPTVLSALIVRPGEHPLATRLLLGARVLVALTGLATFVAAASLTGGWSAHDQHAIWSWAAWTAAGATVLLVQGLVLNRLRGSAKRSSPRPERW